MKDAFVGFCRTAVKTVAENDLCQNVLRDFKSLRALWNYLFLLLYVWVIVWCVLYHADVCGTAAIYATAGVVTAIFTNYVWSSHMDKLMGIPPTPPADIKVGGDGNG